MDTGYMSEGEIHEALMKNPVVTQETDNDDCRSVSIGALKEGKEPCIAGTQGIMTFLYSDGTIAILRYPLADGAHESTSRRLYANSEAFWSDMRDFYKGIAMSHWVPKEYIQDLGTRRLGL
jgi:hypothetical protein